MGLCHKADLPISIDTDLGCPLMREPETGIWDWDLKLANYCRIQNEKLLK